MFVPDAENIKNLDSKDQKSPFAKIHLLLQLPRSNSTTGDGRLAIYKKTSSAFLCYQVLCSACARGAAAWKTSRRLSQVHLCASAHLENTQAGFSHLNSKPFKPPGHWASLASRRVLTG